MSAPDDPGRSRPKGMTNMAESQQRTAERRATHALGQGVPVTKYPVDGRTTGYKFPLFNEDKPGELSGSFAFIHEHEDHSGAFTVLHRDLDPEKQQFVKPETRGHRSALDHEAVLAQAKAVQSRQAETRPPQAASAGPLGGERRPRAFPVLSSVAVQRLRAALDEVSGTGSGEPGSGWPKL